jgi:cellulose 1,4-beta-cellobiosidase
VERGEGARGPIRPTRAGIRYRLGDQKFYGNGSEFKVDTTKPFTVVTQFVTHDGTDTGDVVEIRRKYVQGGVVIDNTNITLNGKTYNSISDDFCEDEATAFKYTN